MQANLPIALADLLVIEGSEVNIGGSEPGGGSRYGVSVTALSDFNKRHGKSAATVDDIRAMTPELAGQFYTEVTAQSIRFNDLRSGPDYRLFDIAANLGPTGGIWAMELALGRFPITGVMSDDLVAQANSTDARMLIRCLSAVWIAKKHCSPNWYPKNVNPQSVTDHGYGHGWSARNIKATAAALALVTA